VCLATENLQEEKNSDKGSIFPKQQAFDPKQIEPFDECNQHPSRRKKIK
jgi:hypothetical protein